METLVGLMFAGSPFAVTVALLLLAERRQKRQLAEITRQIALTDALHARLGAVVAPVVRLRDRVWQVSVAVPVDQPTVAAQVLSIVNEVFGTVAYELRLRRQAPVVPAPREPRAVRATQRSLSWT
ncbi:MAG: hypothetical protein E6K82_03190 [Candidatus Rokuibacteriota bacterium]|nr:MAG: hypothetical protein E6K82_03190 [Candidatus Rokubacteria bacterium]